MVAVASSPPILLWGHGKGCMSPCPPLLWGQGRATPEHWVNWKSGGAARAALSPSRCHLPDARVPPRRAPAARQHLPATAVPQLPALCLSLAAAPCRATRSPVLSQPLHRIPDGTRDTKLHCGSDGPAVTPAAAPGPVPPPLTPLPPYGTAPSPQGGQGAHEPPWGGRD